MIKNFKNDRVWSRGMNFFFKNYLLNIFCLSAGYRLTLYTSDISIQEESLFFFNLKKKKEKKNLSS